MTNAEVDAIQVQHTPVLLQRTLSPRLILLGEALVEATDRAGTGSHSQQRLSHFSHLMGARASYEHLRQPVGNMGFIATVAFKGLRVEVTFTISGHVDVLESTSRGHQITSVGAVAVSFALGAPFSPDRSNELVELFTHHGFEHDPHGALGECSQVLMEDLLLWEYGGRWLCC